MELLVPSISSPSGETKLLRRKWAALAAALGLEGKQAPSDWVVSVAGGELPAPGPRLRLLAWKQCSEQTFTQLFQSKTQFPCRLVKWLRTALDFQPALSSWDAMWRGQMSWEEEAPHSRKVTRTRKWLLHWKMADMCSLARARPVLTDTKPAILKVSWGGTQKESRKQIRWRKLDFPERILFVPHAEES